MSKATLSRTPLHECHLEAGARMVEFAGWEMPISYQGVIEEHRAVRTAAGLFDVSHMGEIVVTGEAAEGFVQWLTPNDVTRLTPGRAHYSGLLNDDGGYLDDLLVYRLGDEELLLVVNAANSSRDLAWIEEQAQRFRRESAGSLAVEDASARYALLALQGPQAVAILTPLASVDPAAIGYYRFACGQVGGYPAILSRTGYTGEDGFELYLAPGDAPALWRRLLAAGADRGLVAAGLGARDTLRLEAGMALYGHELDQTTTPFEAGLGWVVKLDAGDFIGRRALAAQKERGVSRRLVGFEVTDRGIARRGHAVMREGERVGEVTSGTWSPTFEKALGMAYVPVEMAEPETALTLAVRGRELAARVVELPFYRRPKG